LSSGFSRLIATTLVFIFDPVVLVDLVGVVVFSFVVAAGVLWGGAAAFVGVNGDEIEGRGLKYSSLEMAFAELTFSILLKLSYEKLKVQRRLFVRNNTEVVCIRYKRLKTSNGLNV
jgi:hypothetical protein